MCDETTHTKTTTKIEIPIQFQQAYSEHNQKQLQASIATENVQTISHGEPSFIQQIQNIQQTTEPRTSFLDSSQPGPSGLQQTFTCEHCNKHFSSKFKLVRHILIHSDRRQFSCTVCERTFHRKDHLKNHIKVHSPTKKIYICDREQCKKEYTSILSYKKHLAVHFADEGHLDCKICTKKFENKSDLLYHLKIHAGSRTLKNPNEKKFRCEFCDRKFFTRKDVRRHLVVHTGRRDFLCQFCPQRFGRKDHLVRHIKKSHHNKTQSDESLLNIKKEIDSDSSSNIKLEEPTQTEPMYIKLERYTPDTSYLIDPKIVEPDETDEKNIPQIKYARMSNYIPDNYDLSATQASSSIKPDLYYPPQYSDFNPNFELIPPTSDQIESTPTFFESFPEIPEASTLFQETSFTNLPEITLGGDSSGLVDEFQLPDPAVLHESDILELIESDLIMPDESTDTNEDSKPLPGFSQAFQQNPPQKE